MARNRTSFDSSPEGRERARQIRRRHGATSPAEVKPAAERVYRRLRYGALKNVPAKQIPVLRLLASVIAKRELLDQHYDRNKLIDGKRLDPSTGFYGELVRAEMALLERLGLTSVETHEPDELTVALRQLGGGNR